LSGLNRDITNTQTITKDLITGTLDGSVTIDNRWFTEEGRASIVEDFKNAGKNLMEVVELVGGLIDKLKGDKNLTEVIVEKIEEKVEEVKEVAREVIEDAQAGGEAAVDVIKEGIPTELTDKIAEYVKKMSGSAKEPFSQEIFQEGIDNAIKLNAPYCNLWVGQYLSGEGVSIPIDYANNLYGRMEASPYWVNIGFDHEVAQQYSNSGMIVIGTYKDPDAPAWTPPTEGQKSGGQTPNDGTKPGHIFKVEPLPTVYSKKYKENVPQITSWVRGKDGKGTVATTPLDVQILPNKKETATYMLYIGSIYEQK
jgi:F0F1-type ATP synthase membrane subunit b/b'